MTATPHTPVEVRRDPVLEAEYEAAKAVRAISSFDEIGDRWPSGLAERFTANLGLLRSFLTAPAGGMWSLFRVDLVSSWVDGAGVDAGTEHEEPEFWELKRRKKTWDGRFPGEFKLSDFDLNFFGEASGQPVDLQAVFDLDASGCFVPLNDPARHMRVDVYPPKGERGLTITENTL